MKKRTRLYDVEHAAGATFGEWFGWEVPLRFGDPVAEHRAVRAGVGLIDQSYRGILELSGKDSMRFLNGMVTNDIRTLKSGSGLYAAMLTSHGKLIADMRIYALGDAYWLVLHEELLPKVRPMLERHLIADRVDIRDRSEEFVSLAVHGPASTELLSRLGIEAAKGLQEHQHLEAKIDGTPVKAIRASETGEEGFNVLVPHEAASATWEALILAGRSDQLGPVGMEALNLLRIEAGVPWYGLDMDETNLLQEAGLERAASFSKGCYIGQETVIRVAHRGHVNWHLAGLSIEGGVVPEVGTKLIREHREIGRITSAVRSPTVGRPIALGYVRREWKEPGTIVELQAPEGATAEIVSLPFYKRQ
ncbi:MAG: aminomethyltransferase family protein [Candidatus Methylomirabilaceae bacterium]